MTMLTRALALTLTLWSPAIGHAQEVAGFGRADFPLRHLELAEHADDVDQEFELERMLWGADLEQSLSPAPDVPVASEQHLAEEPTLLLIWGEGQGAKAEGTLKACLEWSLRKPEFRSVVAVQGSWSEIARLRFALGKTSRGLSIIPREASAEGEAGEALFFAGSALSQERYDALSDLRAELGFSLCQQQLEALAEADDAQRGKLLSNEAASFEERQPGPAKVDLRGSWAVGVREFKDVVQQAQAAAIDRHGFLLDAQRALSRGDRAALDKSLKKAVKELEKEGLTIDKALAKLEEDPDSDSLTVRGFYVRRDAWQRQNDVLPLLDELLAAQQRSIAARAWRLAHMGAADLAFPLARSLGSNRDLDSVAQKAVQLLEREFTAAAPRAELEASQDFADIVDDISGTLKRLKRAEPELIEFLARHAGTRAGRRAEAWLALI